MNTECISIIIVNYNGRQYLQECLHSIKEQKDPGFFTEIIVVDNASTDGSVKYIKEKFPGIRIIQLNKNYGFAKANNIGVKESKGEYIVFVNNDVLVEKNWLSSLYKRIKHEPNCGAVVGKTMLYEQKHIVQNAGSIVFKDGYARDRGAVVRKNNQSYEEDGSFYSQPTKVAACCGVNMIISKQVFQKVGGFDENYFMYYEDIDLSLSIRRLGYVIFFEPLAKIYHHHSATSKEWSDFFVYETEKSRLIFLLKHYPYKEIFIQMFLYIGQMIFSMLRMNKVSIRMRVIVWIGLHKLFILKKRFELSKIEKRTLQDIYKEMY